MKKEKTIIFFITLISMLFFSTSYAQQERGKIYFIGVGPAGPDLCSLQALKLIQKTDIIYAGKLLQYTFAEFLVGKDIREAVTATPFFEGKPYTQYSKQELTGMASERKRLTKKLADEFKSEIEKGKSVAFLKRGDPCIYENLFEFDQYLNESDYIVIPGMSSLNAGAALLKKELTFSGGRKSHTIIIHGYLDDEVGKRPNTQDLAKHNVTMVLFMAGHKLKDLVDDLKKNYEKDTPIAICYFIGHPNKEKVIRGTLNDIVSKTAQEVPTEMTLVFVGNFLNY